MSRPEVYRKYIELETGGEVRWDVNYRIDPAEPEVGVFSPRAIILKVLEYGPQLTEVGGDITDKLVEWQLEDLAVEIEENAEA